MKNPVLIALAALAFAATSAFCQSLDDLPPYKPMEKVSGTIRVWGNDGQAESMKLWQEGFIKFQPDAKFAVNLATTAGAVAGIYANVADVALMGREIWPVEALAFKKTLGHDLLSVTTMTGSYDTIEKTMALGVFVHRDNPISRLTLAELDAIFTSSRHRGHAPIRTWGDAGLTGEWADKAIHPMGYAIDSGFAFYLEQRVFNGGLNWVDGYAEFSFLAPPKVPKLIPADVRCMQSLAQDRYGIAFSAIPFLNSEVKPIAVADEQAKGSYVDLTRENVASRTYPLIRDMIAVLNREPGKPLDPKVREFMRYVLSREGQQAIVTDGAFLPLPADFLRNELKKID